MKEPEENSSTYRRGYYEGFLAGARAACGLNKKDPIPEKAANLAIRLHTMAIANRDDVTGIEAPPPNALPAQEAIPRFTRNRVALLRYIPHWSDEL